MPQYGPPPRDDERLKVKPPQNLRDVPRYLKETVGGMFSRLFYIVKLVWEASKPLLSGMMFLALCEGVMPIVGTFITANLLAKVVESFSGPVNLILPLCLQFGFIFFSSMFSSLSAMINRMAGEILTNHVRVKIMKKAKTLDLASFDMPDFYERLENANREAGMRPLSILNASFTMISRLISVVGYIAVLGALLTRLGALSYVFFLLFVLLSGTSAAVSFYYRRKGFRYMRWRSKDRRQLNYYSDLMVNKDMVKEIRLFDLSDLFIGRYNDIFKKYFAGVKGLIYRESVWNIVLTLGTAVMNGVLFYMIATHVTLIGDYSVYTGALNAIASALAAVLSGMATIYEGSLFIDNMIYFLEEKQTLLPNADPPLLPEHHIGHTIELRDVSFRYPGGRRDVLKHINITLDAGSTTVLVGLNGAGKTTLIKLITRLYDPTEGVILLDGKDIRSYDVSALYKLYGIIFQDFGKYAESVRDNIWFGQVEKEPTDASIVEAAHRSGADAFIDKLEKGYDTPLMRYFEPEGLEPSIGQWQKLSIARAFYSDSDILILDEPTASLDPMAEQEIYDQFDRLRKDKTTVFVSHRLSSATTADRIVVLENGEITEVGTHTELMEQKGKYYKLFSTQAKRYRK